MEDVLINDMRLRELCFDTINSVDWITIFIDYPDKAIIKDFTFNEYPQGCGLGTRNCEFCSPGVIIFEGNYRGISKNDRGNFFVFRYPGNKSQKGREEGKGCQSILISK